MENIEAIYTVEYLNLKKTMEESTDSLILLKWIVWSHLRIIPMVCSPKLVEDYKELFAEIDARCATEDILKGMDKK